MPHKMAHGWLWHLQACLHCKARRRLFQAWWERHNACIVKRLKAAQAKGLHCERAEQRAMAAWRQYLLAQRCSKAQLHEAQQWHRSAKG